MTTEPAQPNEPATALGVAGVIVAAGLTAHSARRNASPVARQVGLRMLAGVAEAARAAGIPASRLDVIVTRCQLHDLAQALTDAEALAAEIGPAVLQDAILNRPKEGDQ